VACVATKSGAPFPVWVNRVEGDRREAVGHVRFAPIPDMSMRRNERRFVPAAAISGIAKRRLS
jgi:hypothetical protein